MIARLFSYLLIITLLPLAAYAEDIGDWKSVEKLKVGTTIIVETTNGEKIVGEVKDVLKEYMYLVTASGVTRAEKSEVVEVGKVKTNKAKKILLCAGVGAAVGFGLGWLADPNSFRKGNEDPGLMPTLGMLGGAIVGGGAAALDQIGKTRVIYRRGK